MRLRMWMAAGACALGLAGAVALALAGPASAKGIQSATISGPGLDDPIDIDGHVEKLTALTRIWEVMPGQPAPPALIEQAPTEQLGPRYTVTWHLMTEPDETTAIRQALYPDAAGGPLVHTAAGQPIFDGTTVGGWYEAQTALRDMLHALGVPPAAAVSPAKSTPATPPAVGPQSPDDAPWPAVIIAATGGIALASVAAAVAVRRARRRERVAPIPL